MVLVTLLFKYAVIWVNLLFDICSTQQDYHETHPGIPTYFHINHQSKAVHVRVNRLGSKVSADPSVTFVNTMSRQHQSTMDSSGYRRGDTSQQYVHVSQERRLDNSRVNNNSIANALRRNLIRTHSLRIRSNTTSNMMSTSDWPANTQDRKIIQQEKKISWRRTAVGKRQPKTQHKGRPYVSNRNIISGIDDDRCVYRRRSNDLSGVKTVNKGKVVIGTHNRTRKRSKLNCMENSELVNTRRSESNRNIKRIRNSQMGIRRSESPKNRLFHINKAKNKDSAKNTTKSNSIDTVHSHDSASPKPTKDFKSTGWKLDEASSKHNKKTGKKESNPQNMVKNLPNIDQLKSIEEISLNPFAHMDENDLNPTPYFNDSLTRVAGLAVDSDSVIQNFIQGHTKPSNKSTSYVHPDTRKTQNSSVNIPHPNDTKGDKNSTDKSLGKTDKSNDTELLKSSTGDGNNTVLIENQRNDTQKEEEVKISDATEEGIDKEETVDNNVSYNIIQPNKTMEADKRNVSVDDEKGKVTSETSENKTIIITNDPAELGNTSINAHNENNTSGMNLNENSNISISSNDSQQVDRHGKNVSRATRQRRVDATKLVINAVLDAVKNELLNRSISGVQLNATNIEKEHAMNNQANASTTSGKTSEDVKQQSTERNRKNNTLSNTNEANTQKTTGSNNSKSPNSSDELGPGKNESQGMRQRRVNTTKLTINAVLEAVRNEMFGRLDVENNITKNISVNTSGDKLKNSSIVDNEGSPKNNEGSSNNNEGSPKNNADNTTGSKLHSNLNVIRNESFSIRNANNSVIGNVKIGSFIRTSSDNNSVIIEKESEATTFTDKTNEKESSAATVTDKTNGKESSAATVTDKTNPTAQVVWESELQNDEHVNKFKNIRLNTDPVTENMYGTHGVLLPIYENYGDLYDRHEQLDYRDDPVFYRVESGGGFAHNHKNMPPRYWRGVV